MYEIDALGIVSCSNRDLARNKLPGINIRSKIHCFSEGDMTV